MADATDFEHFPVDEKLKLVTQLWDQIAASGEPVSVIGVAERRLDGMIADPSIGISEEEMWRQASEKRT